MLPDVKNPEQSDWLRMAVAGDLEALALLKRLGNAGIRHLTESDRLKLVVSRDTVVAMLIRIRDGSIGSAAAQEWASFVRRGYFPTRSHEPVRPIDISYDASWEDAIVEAITRLDQLGDAIDGQLESGEIDELLLLLGHA